jgi:extracellular elastinolytic metalloproteinase
MSEARQRRQGRTVRGWIGTLAIAGGVVVALALAPAAFAGGELLEDADSRTGSVSPTAAQRQAAERLGATVRWNDFGTPKSLVKRGGFLATGVSGSAPDQVARNWLQANRALFGLAAGDVASLQLVTSDRLAQSDAHAVLFRQRFGDLVAGAGDGLVTVGVSGDRVGYASSTLARGGSLAAQPSLSAREAWVKAAADVGRDVSLAQTRASKRSGRWEVFTVDGFADPQRAQLVAIPTPQNGVRPAWQVLFLDVQGGAATAFDSYVDAASGAVLVRRNIVDQSHQPGGAFAGEVPTSSDGACGPRHDLGTVASGEEIGAVAVSVEAALTINDSVIKLYRDGTVIATQDTLFSPEVLVYDPPDDGQGTYEAQVCDFGDGQPWIEPNDYTGQYAFSPVDPTAGLPYPPKWKVFPNIPLMGNEVFPWNNPSTDIREVWCWESTVGTPPTPLEECDREVQNLASRVPWDYDPQTNTPTFTTSGNNAESGEAWTSPLTPGAFGFRPVSPEREYIYPWDNSWHTSQTTPNEPQGCFEPFVPGESHDISSAVTNLFVMHNRMHDFSYFLGFTERFFNAQDSNFGTGGTAQNDSLIGNAQAGALNGGFPSYLGRDNANMITLPDGFHSITNMYLWQPLAGAFYAPCVDGDFSMQVIGHEYGHMIENRMIGKGGNRSGHHAGAMGESFGDFDAVEYLHEFGFAPVGDENPFGLGTYVTGNKDRAIRNYGMNFPRAGAFPTPSVSLVKRGAPLVNPLNFSDHGYDFTGAQVHADGEIWSATNYDIRQILVEKYNAAFPASDAALQESCAKGERPPEQCPGNRRWIQIVYDAMKLMPTNPSMLDARDAYLAADMMRFGGANQTELWRAFARRGFGERAFSTNQQSNDNPTDPKPDFASPREGETTVRFRTVDEEGDPIRNASIYVGHYEARVSPIADTDPATSAPSPPGSANNLDETAGFVAGTYEFVANAPGYGHVRFRRTFSGGGSQTVTIEMPTNHPSVAQGATATGDGQNHQDLIDDTEETNWDYNNQAGIQGGRVTVDLAGGSRTVRRVHVSAMLFGQDRFTGVRQFEVLACRASAANANCSNPAVGFTSIYTSPEDAFPGFNPRPVAPELILREFDVRDAQATHVMIRVLDNQCTGDTDFHGSQDNDPANGTDCREGSPGSGPIPPIFGGLPQVLDDDDDEVHIAELQVFSTGDGTQDGGDGGGGNGGGGNGGGDNGGGDNGGENGGGDNGGGDDDDDDGGDDVLGLRP